MSMLMVLERGMLPTLNEAAAVLDAEGLRWRDPGAREVLVRLWAQQRGLANLNEYQQRAAEMHADQLVAGRARLNRVL